MLRLATRRWMLILTLVAGAGLFARNTARADSPAIAPDVAVVRLPEQSLVPDVAVDGDGVVHLVYGRDRNAYYQRSTNNGQTFTPPVRINSTGTVETEMGERGPKLALGREGSLHVVWADDWAPGVKTYVRYSRSLDGGKTWEARKTLSAMSGIDGVTLSADAQGHVAAFWHAMADPKPTVPEATWLFQARSSDNGAAFGPSEKVTLTNLSGLACSMCLMRARMDGEGRVLLAFRSAQDSVRDFYVAEGPAAGGPMTVHRVNRDQWVLPTCPMNGPELTRTPDGRYLCAFMSRHRVYWSVWDRARGGFRLHVPTPDGEEDEIYPTAVANRKGEVLLVWQVGPMSTAGTARVKWAVYSRDARFVLRQGTLGTSFSGTKATAFVGSDDRFRIVTTARPDGPEAPSSPPQPRRAHHPGGTPSSSPNPATGG